MRPRLAASVPAFDRVPEAVVDAARASIDRARPYAELAEVVYDSRLDLEASRDPSRVLLFAEATSISLQLRLVPDRHTCFVVGHYYPTWPTSITAETVREDIPLSVDGSGTFAAERMLRGIVRFVFERQPGEPGGARTDWVRI